MIEEENSFSQITQDQGQAANIKFETEGLSNGNVVESLDGDNIITEEEFKMVNEMSNIAFDQDFYEYGDSSAVMNDVLRKKSNSFSKIESTFDGEISHNEKEEFISSILSDEKRTYFNLTEDNLEKSRYTTETTENTVNDYPIYSENSDIEYESSSDDFSLLMKILVEEIGKNSLANKINKTKFTKSEDQKNYSSISNLTQWENSLSNFIESEIESSGYEVFDTEGNTSGYEVIIKEEDSQEESSSNSSVDGKNQFDEANLSMTETIKASEERKNMQVEEEESSSDFRLLSSGSGSGQNMDTSYNGYGDNYATIRAGSVIS